MNLTEPSPKVQLTPPGWRLNMLSGNQPGKIGIFDIRRRGGADERVVAVACGPPCKPGRGGLAEKECVAQAVGDLARRTELRG